MKKQTKRPVPNKQKAETKPRNEQQSAAPELVCNEACSIQNNTWKSVSYIVIFLLAFGLYANTIPYGYVFDDPIVITQNNFTKQGFAGIGKMLTTDSFAGIFGEHGGIIAGGRYRPLSLVTFAIEYQFFGENPHITHALNVLMYALSCMLLFSVLLRLFSYKGIYRVRWLAPFQSVRWFVSVPFAATLLFAAHPLHTEVVANIKERDDIMALLGAVASLWYALRYMETSKTKFAVLSAVMLFLGVMSKENAITFIAIVPLTALFFTNKQVGAIAKTTLPLVAIAVVYVILRQSMLGTAADNHIPNKLMNDPFLGASVAEKYATIVMTFGWYIKLLFYPHPLTVDYYPFHVPIVGWGDWRVIVSLLVCAGLALYVVKQWRKRDLVAYSILFSAINFALYSNVLFPIGTFMTERFMFIPVLGTSIIVVYLLVHKLPELITKLSGKAVNINSYSFVAGGLLLVILGLYSVRTVSRNLDWVDDFTLFSQDVKTSPGSAKGNHVMGELYLLRARGTKDAAEKDSLLRLSIKYSKEGVRIHPAYVRCLHNLGAAIIEQNPANYAEAMQYFVRTIENQPYYIETHAYVQNVVNRQDLNIPLDFKIESLEKIYAVANNHYKTNSSLGTFYLIRAQMAINQLRQAQTDAAIAANIAQIQKAQQADIDKAYFYLERATRIETDDNKGGDYNNLGALFYQKNEIPTAIQWLEKAAQAQPNNAQYLKNLGNLYQMTNQTAKAEAIQKRLNP